MIWAVNTKEDMEKSKTSPVFQEYSQALGPENIKLAVVEETDPLDFVGKDDIVLLRNVCNTLITTIRKKRIKSTAEEVQTYELANDKHRMSLFLQQHGILVPRQYNVQNVEDEKTFFVKPRFGGENVGISEKCICHSKKEVERQVSYIKERLKQDAVIEEYIEGTEITIASCMLQQVLHSYAIERIDSENPIWTAMQEKNRQMADAIAKRVFLSLGLKSHMRIDVRKDRMGNLYVIDVNLIPGLGKNGLLAKSLLLSENISYTDAIKAVVNSATR